MAFLEAQKRQHLIIIFLKKGGRTFAEIKDYIEKEFSRFDYKLKFSERTFQRDKISISQNFNIDIEYDRNIGLHKIVYDDSNQASQRIIDAYNVANAINLSEGLSEFIHFENRKSTGTDFMLDILTAIKNRKIIKVLHQKYGSEDATLREVEPYALKEYKYRWYLVAKDLKDNIIKHFGLDRIVTILQVENKYKYPDKEELQQFFNKFYGVITIDKEPETVVLSFTPFQGQFPKNVPLHHSQKILIDNNKEFRISLTLVPTIDLIMDIQYYGANVKVLKPQWLVNDIKKRLTDTLKQY